MPRGRKSTVRYYFDSVTGSVIAVAKEGIRVLQEIMPGATKGSARGGKRRGRPPGARTESPSRPPRVKARRRLPRNGGGGRKRATS
jgi:hypothetical protein